MFNLYETIKGKPDFYRQLRCGDSLITLFHCLLQNKLEDAWSHYNYFVYVVEGRKIWHTAHGSYDLQKGDCVFVRKGACIVEQFFETAPCFIFFFMPDEFICEALQSKALPDVKPGKDQQPVIRVEGNDMVQAFFHSMMFYFNSNHELQQDLLELKFRELVLTLAGDAANADLRAYFRSLLHQPRTVALQRVVEENFCFNLKLEELARLSARSLSAFKRDFEELYQASPGKWLMKKRLDHALHLLTNRGKTVGEAAFESGFESAAHFSRAFKKHFGTLPNTVKQLAGG
jgi:AraC-like DNA-binding protein